MPDQPQTTLTEPQLLREAILALRLYGLRVNAANDSSGFHQVNDGPALTSGEIVALVRDQGLMPSEGGAQ